MSATTTLAIATFRHIVTLKDGVRVLFRPVTADDYDGLCNLFLPVSPEDREAMRKEVTPEVIRGWIDSLDYARVLPIVAEVRHEIVGEGTLRYGQGPYRHSAEVRIFLAKAWRRCGVGTYLLQTLVDLARRQGLHHLTAEILATNTSAIKAFSELGFKTKAMLEDYFMLPDGRTMDVVLMINTLISHSHEF